MRYISEHPGTGVSFRGGDSRSVGGVEHVALNLKYGTRPAAEVLDELGPTVLRLTSA